MTLKLFLDFSSFDLLSAIYVLLLQLSVETNPCCWGFFLIKYTCKKRQFDINLAAGKRSVVMSSTLLVFCDPLLIF